MLLGAGGVWGEGIQVGNRLADWVVFFWTGMDNKLLARTVAAVRSTALTAWDILARGIYVFHLAKRSANGWVM